MMFLIAYRKEEAEDTGNEKGYKPHYRCPKLCVPDFSVCHSATPADHVMIDVLRCQKCLPGFLVQWYPLIFDAVAVIVPPFHFGDLRYMEVLKEYNDF